MAANPAKRKLFKAAKTGDVDALRAALADGADVHALDGNKWTALHEACRAGQLGAVEVLLEAGADPNAPHRVFKFTPLIVATFEAGHAAIVRALLRAGAELSTSTAVNPLRNTAAAADLETMEVLLEAGADPGAPGSPERALLLEGAADLRARIEKLLARFDERRP